VHGQYPIIIDDERSRAATPDDLPIVARCARILLYERLTRSPADSGATALQRKPSNGSKSRPCLLASPSGGRQATLADFFSPRLRTAVLNNPLTRAQQPNQPELPRTALPSPLPRSPVVQKPVIPNSTTMHCPRPAPANHGQIQLSRPILLRREIPGASPWIPMTRNLYSRPDGSPYSQSLPTTFPIWKVWIANTRPQQAMFQIADNISQTAFYIAADDWTRKPGEEPKVIKRHGAFHNAIAFVISMLEKSTNRCFYEII
jgi:hypothetical protein